MQLQKPVRIVSPFVSHYWLARDNSDSAHPILPDGCVDVVFEIGRTTGLRAYGPATRKAICEVSPGRHYLGICFRPGQARHFLDVPPGEFTDGNLSLAALAGLVAEELADDIASGSVFHRLDAALAACIARQPATADRIDRALELIDRNSGLVPIETLASTLGLSRRQLERRFLDVVGMPPKAYAGIRRWQHALVLLRMQPTLPLATLALNAGYSDQSHMTREFRCLVGQPPRAFADDAFVQDTSLPPDYPARIY